MSPIPIGLCQCGCGQATTVAKQTSARFGHVKGEPLAYARGHNGRTGQFADGDGLCRCGCGRAVSPAKYPSHQRRYVRGHNPANTVPSAIVQRFWKYVDTSGECWIWRGSTKGPLGHSRFHVNRRRMLAHRFAWELAHGPIPNKLLALHRCDNGACVRPDHLFLGTHADNVRDMHAKGRDQHSVAPRARLMTGGVA